VMPSQVALGEIAKLQAGIGFPPNLQGRKTGQFPFAKVGDISRAGRSSSSVIDGADHYVDAVDVAAIKGKLVPAGSVLFAKIGEAIRQNHRVVAGCDMLIDNNAMAAIPTSRVESRYLYRYLQTVDFYELASATTVPALRKSVLDQLLVPLPGLPEQRSIAAILDQADALRALRRKALQELDKLARSLFVEMFGEFRAGRISWPIRPLGELIVDATIGLVRAAEEFGPDFEVPYVRMNAISRGGEFLPELVQRTSAGPTECQKFALRAGDLLFNTRNSRELVGKTALFREQGLYVFNNNLMRIRFTEVVHSEYVAAAFQTPFVQQELETRKAGTTSVFAIYARELKTLPMPTPPMPLQVAFAKQIQVIESLKATHRAALIESDTLFASLQHCVFAGTL
jgi:type I restriction enzyme S subunit